MIEKKSNTSFDSINLVFLSLYIFIAMFLLRLTTEVNEFEIKNNHYSSPKIKNTIIKIYDDTKLEFEFEKEDIFDAFNSIKPSFQENFYNYKQDDFQNNILKKYIIEICINDGNHKSDYWNILKIFKSLHSEGLNFEMKIINDKNCKYLKILSRKIL